MFDEWVAQVGASRLLDALLSIPSDRAVLLRNQQGEAVYWNSAQLTDCLGSTMPQALADFRDQGPGEASCVVLRTHNEKMISVRCERLVLRDSSGARLGWLEAVSAVPAPVSAVSNQSVDVERFHGLLTRDAALKHVFSVIRNVAETDVTVLIRGESGTGKELVARAIHEESPRRAQPFLAINCAALTPSLLESELFGHVRGAFTGALKDHLGLFREAAGGTLFLDEVAELPLEIQAKLLRALQDRTFIPVGATRPVHVDVRIVAATHRSLRDAAKSGQFREDLMYRLRVVPIFLPPLRARVEDIPELLAEFMALHNNLGPRRINAVDPAALCCLRDYAWPGNVRELQNVVAYAFAVGRGPVLTVADLPQEVVDRQDASAASLLPNPQPLEPPDEATRIERALSEANGQIELAARALGMSRATFWRKRRRYGL